MIELINVSKRFGSKTAVNDLNLKIEDGSLTMFIGPSGCGKTTTLRMINRLIEPDGGDIEINGVSIRDLKAVELRRSIGYVIQDIGLFPHFSVYDNIAIVPRLLKWDERRIRDRVMELLTLVTLDTSYANKYPLQLSGGEKQRVGLARALAAEPDILLMDEPFGAIDPINRLKLQDMFLEIQEEIRKTIVFVTHDINEAIKLGDRIAVMSSGNLVQHDPVEELLNNPKDEFVENLLGEDRNLKALTLKKAKDFMVLDGVTIVVDSGSDRNHPDSGRSNGSIESTAIRNIREENTKYAFIVDGNGRLKGRVSLEKPKGEVNPVTVDPNNTITESLSKMLGAGERQLPVVNNRGKLVGVITLSAIFKQMENVEKAAETATNEGAR